jgi:DNA repair exonuclease SbcCD ATPase subunit
MKYNFETLKESFNSEVLALERIKGCFEEKKRSLESITKLIKESKERAEICRQVNLLFEKASVIARKKIKDEIESLVTHGLRSVFEDPTITFVVEFISRRNQIEADFYLEWEDSGKKITGNILNTFGGGLIDIVSVILRLIVLELSKVSGPLFLDEPGKMVSSQFVPNFGRFLVELSKTFGRQIILITHNVILSEYASKTFEIYLNEKGESKVK